MIAADFDVTSPQVGMERLEHNEKLHPQIDLQWNDLARWLLTQQKLHYCRFCFRFV